MDAVSFVRHDWHKVIGNDLERMIVDGELISSASRTIDESEKVAFALLDNLGRVCFCIIASVSF